MKKSLKKFIKIFLIVILFIISSVITLDLGITTFKYFKTSATIATTEEPNYLEYNSCKYYDREDIDQELLEKSNVLKNIDEYPLNKDYIKSKPKQYVALDSTKFWQYGGINRFCTLYNESIIYVENNIPIGPKGWYYIREDMLLPYKIVSHKLVLDDLEK